jgi:hypothetical protein
MDEEVLAVPEEAQHIAVEVPEGVHHVVLFRVAEPGGVEEAVRVGKDRLIGFFLKHIGT